MGLWLLRMGFEAMGEHTARFEGLVLELATTKLLKPEAPT